MSEKNTKNQVCDYVISRPSGLVTRYYDAGIPANTTSWVFLKRRPKNEDLRHKTLRSKTKTHPQNVRTMPNNLWLVSGVRHCVLWNSASGWTAGTVEQLDVRCNTSISTQCKIWKNFWLLLQPELTSPASVQRDRRSIFEKRVIFFFMVVKWITIWEDFSHSIIKLVYVNSRNTAEGKRDVQLCLR